MEHYWQECLRLPPRIQEWDAYKEMRDAIKLYLDVFPTLHKLNSRVTLLFESVDIIILTVTIFSNLIGASSALFLTYYCVGL